MEASNSTKVATRALTGEFWSAAVLYLPVITATFIMTTYVFLYVVEMKSYPVIFSIGIATLFLQHDAILIQDVDWCGSPYCKMKASHTICKWGLMCPPEERCYTNLDFNKKMKDYVMDLHNKKRNIIALGKEDKVPENVRKAADMNVIQWDIHLEYVARCHSRHCDPKHDDCRVVPRFSEVGQNIYAVNYTEKEAEEVDVRDVIKKAVEAWYKEVENVPEEIYIKWDTTKDTLFDHFTQIIWAKTGFMGCGLSEMKKIDASIEYFLVCNYATEGNKKGSSIYTTGEPCSKCSKEKTCNLKYEGLCGTIEEYPLKCPCEEEEE